MTEVAVGIRPLAPAAEIENALTDLDHSGRVLVMPHAPPDVHLETTDLRVVASVSASGGHAEAQDAAEAYWGSWLRMFLANHRCQ